VCVHAHTRIDDQVPGNKKTSLKYSVCQSMR